MADWDADSPELEVNLKRILNQICRSAPDRPLLTLETARQWHTEIMRGLDASDARYVGTYRGDPGLENVQVRIGDYYGVAAVDVAGILEQFERKLQAAVLRLDKIIAPGSALNADRLAAVIDVCAWAHAEWVRIHPFANGNGRTARLWANCIAVRYGLPPFVIPRPRPQGDYEAASVRAMQGDWRPTVVVFHLLLKETLFRA